MATEWKIFRGNQNITTAMMPVGTDPVFVRMACADSYWMWVNGRLIVFDGGLKRGPTPEDSFFEQIDIKPYLLPQQENEFVVLTVHYNRESLSHNPTRELSETGAAFDSNVLHGAFFMDTVPDAGIHTVDIGTGTGPPTVWKKAIYTKFVDFTPPSGSAEDTLAERDTRSDLDISDFATVNWDIESTIDWASELPISVTGGTYDDTVALSSASDLVTNGGFSPDSDWGKGTGWTITGGRAVCDGSQVATSDLDQSITVVSGTAYRVQYIVATRFAGGVTPKIGGVAGIQRKGAGIFSEVIIAGSGGSPELVFEADIDFDGSLDNVVVIESLWQPVTEHTGEPTFYINDATPQPTQDAAWFGRLHARETSLIPICGRLVYENDGHSSAAWAFQTNDLVLGFDTAPPRFQDPSTGEAVTVLPPSLTVYPLAGGNTYAFKLRRNLMVVPGLKATGADGDIIRVYTNQFESGDTAGSPTAKRYFQYEIILTGAAGEEWEAPHRFNGDYVIYELVNTTTVLDETWYREVGYPGFVSSVFLSNDTTLNDLFDKAVNTLEVTVLDRPVNNPDRDRLGTQGEALITLNAGYSAWGFLSVHGLNRSAFKMMHQWYNHGPALGGDIANVAPYTLLNGSSAILRYNRFRLLNSLPAGPQYASGTVKDDETTTGELDIAGTGRSYEVPSMVLAMMGIKGLWQYFLESGDVSTIELMFSDIDDYLRTFHATLTDVADQLDTDDVIIRKLMRNPSSAQGDYGDFYVWDWYDWYDEADTEQTGLWTSNDNAGDADHKLINTALWYMAADAFVRIADQTMQTAHANYMNYKTAKTDIEAAFGLTPPETEMWNNGHSENAYKSFGFSATADQRANALLVVAGLVPSSRYSVLRALLWTASGDPWFPKGSIWMEWLIEEALFKMEFPSDAIARMKKRYETDSSIVTDWRTVVPEFWEGAPKGSHSQGWGASPVITIMEHVAGIKPTVEGFAEYDIYPQAGPLTSFIVVRPTVKGNMSVTWDGSGTPDEHKWVFTALPNAKVHFKILRDTGGANETVLVGSPLGRAIWNESAGDTPFENITVDSSSGTHVIVTVDNTQNSNGSQISIVYQKDVAVPPLEVYTINPQFRSDERLLLPFAGGDGRWAHISRQPTYNVAYLRAKNSERYGITGRLAQYELPQVVDVGTLWRYLEPSQGDYKFDDMLLPLLKALDDDGSRWPESLERGITDLMTMAFRIMCWDINNQIGIPGWLEQEMVAEGNVVIGPNTGQRIPRMDSPTFLTNHFLLIDELGIWIDGLEDKYRRRLHYVDIGTAGFVGEWHYFFQGNDDNDLLPNFNSSQAIVSHYVNALADKVQLIANLGMSNERTQPDNISLIKQAIQGGAGWRQDSFGESNKHGQYHSFFIADDADPVLRDAWETSPVIFEVVQTFTQWNDQNNPAPNYGVKKSLDEGLDLYHMSSLYGLDGEIKPPGPDYVEDGGSVGSVQYEIEQAKIRMGPILHVQQIEHPSGENATVTGGTAVNVDIWFENRGSAPNYDVYNKYTVEVIIGQGADTRSGTATLPKILPGADNITKVTVPVTNLIPGGGPKSDIDIRVTVARAFEPSVRFVDIELANLFNVGVNLEDGSGNVLHYRHKYRLSDSNKAEQGILIGPF